MVPIFYFHRSKSPGINIYNICLYQYNCSSAGLDLRVKSFKKFFKIIVDIYIEIDIVSSMKLNASIVWTETTPNCEFVGTINLTKVARITKQSTHAGTPPGYVLGVLGIGFSIHPSIQAAKEVAQENLITVGNLIFSPHSTNKSPVRNPLTTTPKHLSAKIVHNEICIADGKEYRNVIIKIGMMELTLNFPVEYSDDDILTEPFVNWKSLVPAK